LFEICCGATSGEDTLAWYAPGIESNALFMLRAQWDEVGGYCEQFLTPGGGYASADLFDRAAKLPGTQVIVLTKEATFHQIHTQSASTAHEKVQEQLALFSGEYYRIRKKAFSRARPSYWTFGVKNPPLTAKTKRLANPNSSVGDSRYLDLLKHRILNEGAIEAEGRLLALEEIVRNAGHEALVAAHYPGARRHANRLSGARREGVHLNGVFPDCLTMVGRRRLDSLHQCLNVVVQQSIPGDLVECGIWRGGVGIFMAGFLADRGIVDRQVWLADSFEGLPVADPIADSTFDASLVNNRGLAVDLATVQKNFEKLGLMGPQIHFLPGWFSDTLPTAPIQQIAILRADGDLHSSTRDILDNLYDRVSPGGYLIIDDYALPPCRRAVDAFRSERNIVTPLVRIDAHSVLWRKYD